MMDEVVKDFKLALENLYEEMYGKLDEIICNTLTVMSFYNDGDENLEILQEAIISVARDQMVDKFGMGEELS